MPLPRSSTLQAVALKFLPASVENDEGRLAFAEDDGPAAHDDEIRIPRRRFHPDPLLLGKYAGEQAAGGQACSRYARVVADVTAQLEPACDLLRVIAFDAAARGKIRWTAEDDIELLVGFENVPVAEIAVANVEAVLKSIPVN